MKLQTFEVHTEAPDFNEAYDQLSGLVTALEGLEALFGGQDTSLNPEYLAQVMETYVIRAKLCQKALGRAVDVH